MGKEKNSSNSYPEASYFFYSKKLHISEGSHLQKASVLLLVVSIFCGKSFNLYQP